MTKPLCSKASQVAKAANSLPKPSQIRSKPTALQPGISDLSSQAPLIAPKGASAPSPSPWESIPDMITSSKDSMKQIQGEQTRKLLSFPQFDFKPRIKKLICKLRW